MSRDVTCWICDGRGYVSDGQPEDGMMTGRVDCPNCGDSGIVSEAEVRAQIARLEQLILEAGA